MGGNGRTWVLRWELLVFGTDGIDCFSNHTGAQPPVPKQLAKEVLYNLILETNKQCIKLCKPGISIQQIHNFSVKMLRRGLVEIGILKDNSSIDSYHKLNPTSIGHYLGMDIHDSSKVSNYRLLQPGVVITIEPGVYIPHSFHVPEWCRGIGIRLEDDILITDTGHEVLTASIPKEVPHIKSLLNIG